MVLSRFVEGEANINQKLIFKQLLVDIYKCLPKHW